MSGSPLSSQGPASAVERPSKRGEAARQSILEAALRLFTRKGIVATSIDDIIAEADIARMAVYNHLLLMDEPFAALDEFTREQLNDDMIRIRDERKLTILFVTHNLREAVYISDRVAVLAGQPSHLIYEEALVRSDPVRDRALVAPTMIASYRRLRDQLSTARA